MIIALAILFWPKPEPIFISETRLNSNPFRGNPAATVIVTEYADFGCTACWSWHQAGILDALLERFDNQIKIEWRDFPVITARSPKAAQAGQCAFDQQAFWEFHDAIYDQPNQGVDLGIDTMKETAESLGLDTDLFNNCLDSGQHQATVNYDLDEARSLGLPGTPGFLVNGRVIVGANPDLLVQAIENALLSGE